MERRVEGLEITGITPPQESNLLMKNIRLKPNLYPITIGICIITIAFTNTGIAQGFSDFYSDSEIQFYDPNSCAPETASNDSTTPAGSGKWKLNPGANRSGADLTPLFKKFLDKLAEHTSFEPIVTTGTNHSQYSASGNVSDHWAGNGADFGSVANNFGTNTAQPGDDVPRGDEIATAALVAAGMEKGQAKSKAKQGGLINQNGELDGKSIRVQVIWKTDVGGNHHDHVHVGIKDLSTSYRGNTLAREENSVLKDFKNLLGFNNTASAASPDEDGSRATGNSIYILGDSITEGARDNIDSEFAKKNLDISKINADTGRAISKDTAGSNPSGLEAVESDSESIKKSSVILIALGTNSGSENLDTQIPKLIEKIKGIKPNIKILWVNVFAKASTVDSDTINEKIKTHAKDEGYSVIDTTGVDIELSGDNIHPTSSGSKKFAKLLAEETASNATGSSNDTSADSIGQCCGSGGGSTLLSGKDNKEKIWNYLIGKGLNNIQVAGIMGNIKQESGFDPNALNPGSKAYGIAQWYQGRKTALERFAKSKGKPINDLGMQLDFLWKELNEGYKSRVLDPIKKSNDLGEVVLIWLERFEVPCMPGSCGHEQAIRLPFAQAIKQEAERGGSAGVTAADGGDASDIEAINSGCSEGGADSSQVNADGYAMPTKREGINLPCKKETCHHDGTPAADLGISDKWEGTPVYAITDGKIEGLKYRRGLVGAAAPAECKSFQLVAKDGYQYWYGHIKGVTVDNGEEVKAGQKIAVIGQSSCADHTPPHLHIDRGSPKGHYGGSMSNRDPAFIPLLDKIYEESGS